MIRTPAVVYEMGVLIRNSKRNLRLRQSHIPRSKGDGVRKARYCTTRVAPKANDDDAFMTSILRVVEHCRAY